MVKFNRLQAVRFLSNSENCIQHFDDVCELKDGDGITQAHITQKVFNELTKFDIIKIAHYSNAPTSNGYYKLNFDS